MTAHSNTLSKAILTPRDLFLSTPEAQKIALFFDHILVWPLSRHELENDESIRIQAEIEYLVEMGVVSRCGFQIPSIISFQTESGDTWDPFSHFSRNCELVLPFEVIANVPKDPKSETDVDRIVRHVSDLLLFNEAPVTANIKPTNLPTSNSGIEAIEIVLSHIPLPPNDIPWQDLIQFRNDDETKAHLRRLRVWLQERSVNNASAQHISEELRSLLDDYCRYMAIQHKKFGEGSISTLIISTPDAVENLLNLNFGSALRSLFDFRSKKLDLQESEFTAPGREVAYIAKTHNLFK